MQTWPRFPTLYEINSWVWLGELRKKHGKYIDLGTVPAWEWDQIAALGMDAVWLMGVWERSPAGTAISNRNQGQVEGFRQVLPDFQTADNVGSPYCIKQYVVDVHLGGSLGLAAARQELAKRGMRLLLDFVPNHLAPDHPWINEHPDYFIQGTHEDLRNDPVSYVEISGRVFACGRDPYFPAWQDVVQVNAFASGLRHAAVKTLANIAQQCDGVRCDMAMLLLNSIFERTWGGRAGPRPPREYWRETIPAVKRDFPNFLFIAESYWDLEWELQQQGFDFCYDKRLYDRLEHENAESVRLHLSADLAYQGKLLRFLENHDEPRAAAIFPGEREQAAAVVTATLPGARLFHEGQFAGRKVRLPVFLARRPEEPLDERLRDFYKKLLQAINKPVFRDGQWKLCERSGWPDNPSFQDLVAWCWRRGSELHLIVVNLSDHPAQARVFVEWPEPAGGTWHLTDGLSGAQYARNGEDVSRYGLYVELGPWGYHFLFWVVPPA